MPDSEREDRRDEWAAIHDENMRLECLKVAGQLSDYPGPIMRWAKDFEKFVKTGEVVGSDEIGDDDE